MRAMCGVEGRRWGAGPLHGTSSRWTSSPSWTVEGCCQPSMPLPGAEAKSSPSHTRHTLSKLDTTSLPLWSVPTTSLSISRLHSRGKQAQVQVPSSLLTGLEPSASAQPSTSALPLPQPLAQVQATTSFTPVHLPSCCAFLLLRFTLVPCTRHHPSPPSLVLLFFVAQSRVFLLANTRAWRTSEPLQYCVCSDAHF